jgi:hypothetical protein
MRLFEGTDSQKIPVCPGGGTLAWVLVYDNELKLREGLINDPGPKTSALQRFHGLSSHGEQRGAESRTR